MPEPPIPQWLLDHCARLPNEQRGVATGFLAAGFVAGVEAGRALPARDVWMDGYRAGCEMSHSVGCDAVEGERDWLRERLAELEAKDVADAR